VLLTYLSLTWMTWWLARAFDQSPAWARLTDSSTFGRWPMTTEDCPERSVPPLRVDQRPAATVSTIAMLDDALDDC